METRRNHEYTQSKTKQNRLFFRSATLLVAVIEEAVITNRGGGDGRRDFVFSPDVFNGHTPSPPLPFSALRCFAFRGGGGNDEINCRFTERPPHEAAWPIESVSTLERIIPKPVIIPGVHAYQLYVEVLELSCVTRAPARRYSRCCTAAPAHSVRSCVLVSVFRSLYLGRNHSMLHHSTAMGPHVRIVVECNYEDQAFLTFPP